YQWLFSSSEECLDEEGGFAACLLYRLLYLVHHFDVPLPDNIFLVLWNRILPGFFVIKTKKYHLVLTEYVPIDRDFCTLRRSIRQGFVNLWFSSGRYILSLVQPETTGVCTTWSFSMACSK